VRGWRIAQNGRVWPLVEVAAGGGEGEKCKDRSEVVTVSGGFTQVGLAVV
jgi:hypothetical protein